MGVAYSTPTRNGIANAITAQADGGSGAAKYRVYTAPRPASGGSVTTLLAELTCADPSAPNAVNGIRTLNAITGDPSANASGTPVWYRLVDSDGTFVEDGDVNQGVGSLVLDSSTVTENEPVNIDTAVYTVGNT